jgi:hypothetical protein
MERVGWGSLLEVATLVGVLLAGENNVKEPDLVARNQIKGP